MKKLLAAALAALTVVLGTAGVAEISVKVSPDMKTNYRSQPDLEGKKLGTLKSEQTRPFAYQSETDDRGVAWYLIDLQDKQDSQVWVSSKYTTLTDGTVDNIVFAPEDSALTYRAVADDTLVVDPEKRIGDTNVSVGDPLIGWGCSYVASDGTEFVYVTTMEDVTGWLPAESVEADTSDTDEVEAAPQLTGEQTVTSDAGVTLTYNADDFTVAVNPDGGIVADYLGDVKAGFSIDRCEGADAQSLIAEKADEYGVEAESGSCFGEQKQWYYVITEGEEDDARSIDTDYARDNADGAWVVSVFNFPTGDEATDMACSDAIELALNSLTFAD